MRIELSAVTKGRAQRALPETSLVYGTGVATLAVAETEQRPTVLGLLASGRMRPDTGSVLIDDRADAASLRRRIALVDAVDVSEPEANVSVVGVVAEELMFAGYAPNPFSARRWLDDLGLGDLASTPIGNIDPAHRIRILLELAVLRAGVEGLVLASPDRHGGEPAVWWGLAREFADRGYAVLVIAGRASRTALGAAVALTLPSAEPEPEPTPEPEPEPAPAPEPEPESEPAPEPAPSAKPKKKNKKSKGGKR